MNKSEKIRKQYDCEGCDYHTSDLKDYNKHLATDKHIRKHSERIFSDKSEEIRNVYTCELCDYHTNVANEYSRHLTSAKHNAKADKSGQNPKKSGKIRKTYTCELCDYHTIDSNDYRKHLETKKHTNKADSSNRPDNTKQYVCEICDKSYSAHSGLWKHKKTCIAKEGELQNVLRPFSITAEMFMELMKQNKDLQELLKEDRKIIVELSKNGHGNVATNSHNNTTMTNSNNSFNLSFFLNEQCKNALNIYEFVDSLNPTLQDMERTGKVGFVDGITGIILNGLRDLDVYTRPIHCTDLKRDVLYVKDNDKWEKEADDKPLLRKAVKRTANKNFKQIRVWEQQHPDYTDTDTWASDEHVALCQKLMGGMTADESEKLENSIMKNVLKKVTIDKEALMVA